MENVRPDQILIPMGIVAVIGILLLIFGDRPELYARIRSWFADRPAHDTITSSVPSTDGEDRSVAAALHAATAMPSPSNNSIVTPQEDTNELLLHAKAEALAAMVKAGKVGETEGLKIVFKVSPSSTNPRYQVARSLLKEELAKLEPGPQYRAVEVAPGPTTITRPKNGW